MRPASAGLAAPGAMRHCQLPPALLGVFIRAEAGSASQSCMGMTAVSLTLAKAVRMKASTSASLSPQAM